MHARVLVSESQSVSLASSPHHPQKEKRLKNEWKLTLAYKDYFNFLTNSPKTFKTNLQRRDNKVRRFFLKNSEHLNISNVFKYVKLNSTSIYTACFS